MTWEDIKPIVEVSAIVISAFGAGGLIIWWKRVTNQKQVEAIQEKLALLKIDIKQLREEYETLKAAYDKVMIIIEASEFISMKDEKFAKEMIEYLFKNKDK